MRTLSVLWSPREKFRDSVEDRWLNHTFTSGASEGKTSTTCTKHNEDCKGGAEDWLAQNFELSNDFTLANCHIHPTAVFVPHQPTKVARTTSIMEPLLIEPTNVTNCPGQVHQPQHDRGRTDQKSFMAVSLAMFLAEGSKTFTRLVGLMRTAQLAVATLVPLDHSQEIDGHN